MGAVSLGPLVLAADRLAVVLGMFGFLAASAILAQRLDQRFEIWSWWTLIGGIVTARIGHVGIHWRSFADEPLRALAFWDGGLYWPAGAFATALSVLLLLKSSRQRLLAFAPLAVGLIIWNTAWQLTGETRDIPLPQKTFTTLTGDVYVLDAKTDRPRVLNLWASWCPPCRREMPMMAELALESDNVEFLFVNQSESRGAIEKYLSDEGLTLETVLLDPFGQLARHYGVIGLPATLFIDATGTLKHAHTGEISREALQSHLLRLSREK